MKLSNFAGLSLAVIGLVVLSSGAQAQFFGTFGFVPFGSVTANASAVNNATSITVPALELVNTAGPALYQGHTNIFAAITGSAVTLTTTTLSNGGSVGLSVVVGTTTYTFTPNTTINFLGTTNGSGSFANFGEFGTVTSTTGAVTSAGQSAELDGNFNQTSAGGAINGSFTFSTPPTPSTPEPGAVAMLVGMGISGSAFAFRRRRNAK